MADAKTVLQAVRGLLPRFESALSSFASSAATFQVLRSLPAPSIVEEAAGVARSSAPPRTLYVLDASFNPPTQAHAQMMAAALREDRGPRPRRLLLLLATQNADKATSPAPFAHRLALMTVFASDLLGVLSSTAGPTPVVDIGVTKFPFFHDKARAISESSFYNPDPPPEQVHLAGYDTLIRILNPKYYPPSHTLAPLSPFLDRHRLRVYYRPGDEWGGKEDQEEPLRDLAEGRREKDGGRREWASRIDLVGPMSSNEEGVSSTKIRNAIQKGDHEALTTLATKSVADWILQENLYTA
ncbi:MAG: hypothetical protein M1837_000886 [Sclerophora amabilis]|nr:MAG: hypothetical protein M1837_000886 [Sclerophora amabilis]